MLDKDVRIDVSEFELDETADAELIALIDPRYLTPGKAKKHGPFWQAWQRLRWVWSLMGAREAE